MSNTDWLSSSEAHKISQAESMSPGFRRMVRSLGEAGDSGASSGNSELLSGRILPGGAHTKVGDDMAWPSYDQGDLEWQLRYGTEQQVMDARMRLASIVGAYRDLLGMTQKRRNEICRAIREAR